MNRAAGTGKLTRTDNWIWLLGQLVLMAAVFAAGWYFPGSVDSWLRHRTVGIILVVISTMIGLAGVLSLRSSLSAFPQPNERRLISTGIYRWARHPMYTGLIVLALGWVLWTGSGFALIAIFPLWWFFRRKAALEEEMLSRIYPDHAQYAARTWCFFLGRPRNNAGTAEN